MLKKIRYSIRFILSLALIISILPINSIKANETDYYQILRDKGYPEEFIDSMPYEEIVIQATNDYEFGGTFTEDIYFDDNEVTTRGTLPSADLRISISYTIYRNSDNSLRDMYVSAQYKWLTFPSVYKIDSWGIAWDNNKFRYKDDSYTGRRYCYNPITGTENHDYRKTYTTLREISSSAIAGDFDFFSGQFSHIFYATCRLKAVSPTTSGSLQLYVSYAHNITPAGCSITLPTPFGGGVSFSGLVDSATRSFTLEW